MHASMAGGSSTNQAASRLSAQWGFFKELKDLGKGVRETMACGELSVLGQKSTLDLPEAYS